MDDNCSLTNMNFSDPNCFSYGNIPRRPTGPDKNTEVSLKLIFCLFAIFENLLLIYVIYKDPLKRFRNTPTYFIISFTIADLLSTVSGVCDSIFQLNSSEVRENQEIAGCFAGIGVQSSFLIIMIFAIDRYVAIVLPYKYRSIMSRHVFIALLFFPWCFAIITLPVIYFHPKHKYGRTLTNMFAGDIIALTGISLIIHPATHWTFKRKMKQLMASTCANKQIVSENLKISRVLATTVLVVSICLITFMSPYLVTFSFSLAGCDRCFISYTFQSFWKYYPLLTSIRLMINPLVYAWRLPLYRKALKAIFRNHHEVRERCFITDTDRSRARWQPINRNETNFPMEPVPSNTDGKFVDAKLKNSKPLLEA